LIVEYISDSPKEQQRLVIIIDEDILILGKECLH
tara:strand:+ start:40 stop:141 length:102 start_codon:yes stop_codon:yes gene_type:complete